VALIFPMSTTYFAKIRNPQLNFDAPAWLYTGTLGSFANL